MRKIFSGISNTSIGLKNGSKTVILVKCIMNLKENILYNRE